MSLMVWPEVQSGRKDSKAALWCCKLTDGVTQLVQHYTTVLMSQTEKRQILVSLAILHTSAKAATRVISSADFECLTCIHVMSCQTEVRDMLHVVNET